MGHICYYLNAWPDNDKHEIINFLDIFTFLLNGDRKVNMRLRTLSGQPLVQNKNDAWQQAFSMARSTRGNRSAIYCVWFKVLQAVTHCSMLTTSGTFNCRKQVLLRLVFHPVFIRETFLGQSGIAPCNFQPTKIYIVDRSGKLISCPVRRCATERKVLLKVILLKAWPLLP